MALVEIAGLYTELLLDASFRGVDFAVLDSRDQAGRRSLAFLFPGQDRVAFQDLGQLDGDITINGIIVGDDYVHQGDRLRDAFQTPGPASLSHPWVGDIQVMLAPGHPPEIRFDHDKLRVCLFTVTLRRYIPRPPATTDTLQGLLDGLSSLRSAARGLLRQVLAPIAQTLQAIAQVERFAGELAGTFGTLIMAARNPLVGIAGGLPIGLLTSIGSLLLGDNYADDVADRFAGPSVAIAGTSLPVIPSAVAPGGLTTTADAVDARETATLILAAIGASMPGASDPAIRRQIAACAIALMIADACTAASDIDFDSQTDAAAWRDQVADAIDGAAALAATLVAAEASTAAPLWRGLIAAKGAWIADMSATIGRLPAVRRFTPPGQVPVWVLAHYLVGDDPSAVLPTWLDLVRRNDIHQPALPPPGPLETLA